MNTSWLVLYNTVRDTVDDVAAGGGRCRVQCADGFTMSVIAYEGTYCTPRPGYPVTMGGADAGYTGPFTEVEVGFPSVRPEPWDTWAEHCETPDDPTETVYAYVPVETVNALVELHGGYA